MADKAGHLSQMADPVVRILTGHVVSSTSMVSRAYLSDPSIGVVIDAGDRGLWLASTLAALVPDPDDLRRRAAETGGIPVEHGSPRLVKLTLGWGGVAGRPAHEDEVSLANPMVTPHPDDASIAVVSLNKPAAVTEKVGSGLVSLPVASLAECSIRSLGEQVGVVSLVAHGGTMWPMVRWVRVASDPGFAGQQGAVALDLSLPAELSGSPAFYFDAGVAVFCGLVSPLAENVAIMVAPAAIAEAIPAG